MKNEMPQAAIVLVDREGRKTAPNISNPVHSTLDMELVLKEEMIHIKMWAMAAAQGNGSAGCEVTDLRTGEVVYAGGGSYFSLGAGSTPRIYVPGPWEKVILDRAKQYTERLR
jgi:hypothetical protein